MLQDKSKEALQRLLEQLKLQMNAQYGATVSPLQDREIESYLMQILSEKRHKAIYDALVDHTPNELSLMLEVVKGPRMAPIDKDSPLRSVAKEQIEGGLREALNASKDEIAQIAQDVLKSDRSTTKKSNKKQ